jgi:hypothetical protein
MIAAKSRGYLIASQKITKDYTESPFVKKQREAEAKRAEKVFSGSEERGPQYICQAEAYQRPPSRTP